MDGTCKSFDVICKSCFFFHGRMATWVSLTFWVACWPSVAISAMATWWGTTFLQTLHDMDLRISVFSFDEFSMIAQRSCLCNACDANTWKCQKCLVTWEDQANRSLANVTAMASQHLFINMIQPWKGVAWQNSLPLPTSFSSPKSQKASSPASIGNPVIL